MQKMDYLTRMIQSKVVAVLRAESYDEAIEKSEACLIGGINSIELTFTTPDAEKAIATLSKKFPKKSIGAGTVLDPITAKIAIDHGAQYVVSPAFDRETALLCNVNQIPYIPGCMTVTEMKEALTYGSDIIKLFPGSQFGPNAIKDFKGPLPQLNIMPTGGVNLTSIREWFEAGAVAVGIGSALTKGSASEIENKAQEYMMQLD